MMRPYCLLIAAVALLAEAVHGDDFVRDVLPLVQKHCVDCHNADVQEGSIDLQRFESWEQTLNDRGLWKQIFDVVESGQMPLRDSGYELKEEDREQLLAFIRQLQTAPDPVLGVRDPGKPVLRRLTRLEYNNTVRDLFGLSYDIFMFPERLPVADKRYFLEANASLGNVVRTSMREYGQKYEVLLPQIGLPGDNRAEGGYANRGDALNMSPLLLEKYLELAAAVSQSPRLLEDSSVMQDLLGIDPAEIDRQSITARSSNDKAIVAAREFASQNNIGQHAEGNDTWKAAFVTQLTDAFEHGSGGVFDIPATLNNQTVASKGGLLKVRVGEQTITINPNVDIWLAAFATADETSGDHLLTNRNKGEKLFELTFDQEGRDSSGVIDLGVCVLSRRKQQGPVSLTAVLNDGLELTRSAVVDEQYGNVFYSFVAPPGTVIRRLRVDGSQYSGDYILLDDFGFILKQNNKSSLLPESVVEQQGTIDGRRARSPLPKRVEQFLRSAYRCSVTEEEVDRALHFVQQLMKEGASEKEALQRLVQTTLTSPEFLFLEERIDDSGDSVRSLDRHELASRLSYFLWSSMPDEELLHLATSEQLHNEEVLRAQVRRMLGNRQQSRELSESFAVQWLRLDQLYTAKPDRKLYPTFYSGPQGKSTMHAAMMTEALLLFESVLVEDRSVLELVDPDYTWLNESLAKHYGLQTVYEDKLIKMQQKGLVPAESNPKSKGQYWLRCELPDRDRGGVLTMAGPLTLTSLPFRTSPIKRGAWLLETVFNRPPAEPKVAFVLEEESTTESEEIEYLTVRQRFERHRTDPNCYSCHSRIDPPGFALESFDAIGSYRIEDGDQPVDATGKWNGRDFDGPAEFKAALRVRETEFVRGFAEHLLSYALGRRLEHFDQPAIDEIVARAAMDNYRISSLIEGVVLSYPFRNVRNTLQ